MKLLVLLFCSIAVFGQSASPAPETKPQAGISDQKSLPDYGLGIGARGRPLGQLDILSDTQRVDFGPYLREVLKEVRQHWYILIPESAEHKKGRLAIEFAITKDGQVADMRLVASSGDIALDRPAWGSITDSTPFPALPAEFKGKYLALRFRYYYNPDDLKPDTTGTQVSIFSSGSNAAEECNQAGKEADHGNFATRYPWYVQEVQSKIREKWVTSEQVDPYGQSARRVCLRFDINRRGEPSNIRIVQSSGVSLLDDSAVGAVNQVSSFGPLPPGYERDKASVLFWFDYKPRMRDCTAEDYLKSSGMSEHENGLRVFPEGLKISLGSNQLFRLQGVQFIAIPSWSIEGERCKANDCGSVSALGLYTAPRTMPSNPEITLKVAEKTEPCRTGTTRLTLVPEEVH